MFLSATTQNSSVIFYELLRFPVSTFARDEGCPHSDISKILVVFRYLHTSLSIGSEYAEESDTELGKE